MLQDGCAGITVDDLKDQLTRHEGLLENLTISIGKWLVPPRPTAARKSWCQMLRFGQITFDQLVKSWEMDWNDTKDFVFWPF